MTKNYDNQAEATLAKWSREEDRKKAKADASADNFSKQIAAALKKDNIKKALAREAKNVVDGGQRPNDLIEKASDGLNIDDNEVITGNEPRPWEEY